MLRNRSVGVYGSDYLGVTNVYGPTLFAIQGGGGVKFPEKNITKHLNGPWLE